MLPSVPSGLRRVGRTRWAAAVFAFALALSTALPAHAVKNDARLWATAIGRVGLPKDLLGFLFVQARLSEDISEFERLVIRPSIGKPLGKGFLVSLGYDAHIIRTPIDVTEQRAWQEVAYGHAFDRIRTLQRARLEQRFIPGGGDAAWRLRLMTLASFPLPFERLRAVASNEFFFDLNETLVVRTSGFSENRLFGGFEYPLGGGVSVQLGYLLQYIVRPRQDEANHTLFVGTTIFP